MTLFIEGIEAHLGKPYLHYKTQGPTVNLEGAKMDQVVSKILSDAQTTFADRFNKFSGSTTNLSFNDIQNLLHQWDSESGIIGKTMESKMQQIADFNAKGIAQNYSTSGGLLIEGTDTYLSQESYKAFQRSKKTALENISKIHTTIDNSVDSIIKVMANNNEYLMVAAIVQAYYEGMDNIPATLKASLPPNFKIEKYEIDLAEKTRVPACLTTIRQKLNDLDNISGRQSKSEVLESYKSAVESISKAMNTVGGFVGEAAAMFASWQGPEKGKDMLVKNEEEIRKIVEKSGCGTYASCWSGENKAVNDSGESTGKDAINDIEIFWNKDGIIFTLGGSVKTRQGKGFRIEDDNKSLKVGGFSAKETTFEKLARDVSPYFGGANVEKFAGEAVAALGRPQSEYSKSWYNMKSAIGALTLLDSVSGLGKSSNDFASLFIVNNRIYSMADILTGALNMSGSQVTKQKTKLAMGEASDNSNAYYVENLDLGTFRKDVDKFSQKKEYTIYKQACYRVYKTYDVLQNAKVKIALNLTNISQHF